MNRKFLIGAAVVAVATLVLTRAVTREPPLPDREEDAVNYVCSEDGHKFRMTPAQLDEARQTVPTPLGVAPCPKCNKPTGIQPQVGEPAKASAPTRGVQRLEGGDVVAPPR